MNAFFVAPGGAVLLLLAANSIGFLVSVALSGQLVIPADVLLRMGALHSGAFVAQEYWRAVSYGFLHANPGHLLGNMLALVLWGPHLERRVGFSNFLLIYLVSLIGGGVVTHEAQPGPFLTVGASGAVSGLLAALFALFVLGESELDATFFLVNFGLNFALSTSVPNVDWRAHFGGFAAGFIVCALLDLSARIESVVLRCKFSEFAKANCYVALAFAGAAAWTIGGAPRDRTALIVAGGVILGFLILVKSIDLLLSVRRGAAWAAVLLASLDAGLALSAVKIWGGALPDVCKIQWPGPDEAMRFVGSLCAHPVDMGFAGAGLAFVAALSMQRNSILRGARDAGGFVAASFVGERKRRRGRGL